MTYPYLKQFEKYVMPVTESGCWLWLGYVSKNGYGRFSPKWQMKPQYAHRVSYEIYNGPIPKDLHIDHLCGVRCCVNPNHLECVTQQENILRGNGTGGRSFKERTHCKNGHLFIEGNFYTRKFFAKDGSLRGRTRICLTCEKLRNKEKYWRLRYDRS